MKQAILILINLLVILNLYAQEEGADYFDPFSKEQILPPSPSVASLGKFGDIPVSTYTGIPNISIPIWNVQSKSLSLPISVNYHSGGLKVDEVAGWVGIGWALNAGGVISRTVYGKPDDQNGYLVDGSILPDPNTNYSDFVSWRPADAALNLYLNGSKDLQPDIYNYNFAGRSGKFIIDANNNIYTLDHKVLDIEVDWINGRFTITDESGIQYVFGSTIDGTRDAYETTSIGGGNSYKSAWHLVEIIAPGNTDKVELYYKQENLDWSVTPHETRYVRLTSLAGAPILSSQLTASGASYFTLKIDSIISNRSKIVFGQEPGRDDLSSGANRVKLGFISIRDKDNIELKKFSFNYGYLSSGGTTYKDKRLKLVSIKESGQNQQEELPPYQFFYNENNIPKRGSKSQDHWGYYNGAVNTTLVPSMQLGNEVLAGANREPNEAYLYGGILEKIVYPTGGYTEFEYEPHRYSYIKSTKIDEYVRENNVSKIYHATYISDGFQVTFDHEQYIFIDFESQPFMMEDVVILNIKKNGATIKSYTARADETLLVESGTYDFEFIMTSGNDQADLTLNYTEYVTGEVEKSKLAGGLRIKKISSWDNSTASPIVKKYVYEEQDGTSNGILTAHFPKYTYNIKNLNVTGTGPTGFPNEGDPFVYLARSSHNLGQGAKTHGADVAYQKVVELHGENGENGSVEFFYTNSRTYQDHEIRANPFPPTISRDWQRGLLTKKVYFDNSKNKLKEINNYYTFNDQVHEPNFRLIPGVKATYILKSNYPANTEYSWITYTHEAGWKYKNKTIETSYFTEGSVIKTIEYKYDNPGHCLPTEIKTFNSDGTENVKRYRYPQDYNSSASNYHTLIGKNILNKPVDRRTYNGSTLASGAQYEYNNNGDLIHIYQMESKTDILFEYNDPYTFTHKNSVSYNSEGRIKKVTEDSNITTYYVWAYNSQYPVIKIQSNNSGLNIDGIQAVVNGYTLSESDQKTDIDSVISTLKLAVGATDGVVTYYTYSPLLGITSETNQRGQTIYYRYDGFGRLEKVLDQDGIVIKEYEYEYATQAQ